MNTKAIVTIIVVIVIILGAWFLLRGEDTVAPTEESGTTQQPAQTGDADNEAEARVVTYTNSGFSPATVTVQQGGSVTFLNSSTGSMWVATALHPTHTVYPGSSLALCGTAQASTIFDACTNIPPGGSWTFTFTQIGSWGYHNHAQVSHTGRVVVE